MKGQTLKSFFRWKWAVAVFDENGELVDWDATKFEDQADRIVKMWGERFRGKGYTIHKIGTVEIIKT